MTIWTDGKSTQSPSFGEIPPTDRPFPTDALYPLYGQRGNRTSSDRRLTSASGSNVSSLSPFSTHARIKGNELEMQEKRTALEERRIALDKERLDFHRPLKWSGQF